jgi:poly-gamma-glutamate biosynthesis protein PgsC/CapC
MPYETAFAGLLFSLLYIGLTGLYPGGVIVPSYLVLILDQPYRLAVTLAAALLALLCFRLASQYLILFGARRFVFMILVAALWSVLGARVFSYASLPSPEFHVIGWIVPGLISNTFERQGVLLTTASLVTVTVVAYFAGRILQLIA